MADAAVLTAKAIISFRFAGSFSSYFRERAIPSITVGDSHTLAAWLTTCSGQYGCAARDRFSSASIASQMSLFVILEGLSYHVNIAGVFEFGWLAHLAAKKVWSVEGL
jgi:hypothetical protein